MQDTLSPFRQIRIRHKNTNESDRQKVNSPVEYGFYFFQGKNGIKADGLICYNTFEGRLDCMPYRFEAITLFMRKSVKFILDTMTESGFTIPDYVSEKRADVEVTDDFNDIGIDSQKSVWLSAVKLACGDFLPAVRDSYQKKVTDAAMRYGIYDHVKDASAFVERMDIDPQQIRTEFDWKRTKNWLEKNAGFMDEGLREGIVDHLFEKAAELGYTPMLSEKCALLQIAGRDPMSPEVQKLAEDSIHKLASGKHYTTDQFEALPFEEVKELLPDLVKQASLGMTLLHPRLFAKVAETADESSAMVLDALLQKYGQMPILDESELPVEINDEILWNL